MKLELSKTAFWDVDMQTLDEHTQSDFIIARVFQYGLLNDLKIILKTYSKQQIINAFKTYRGMDKHTLALAQTLGYISE